MHVQIAADFYTDTQALGTPKPGMFIKRVWGFADLALEINGTIMVWEIKPYSSYGPGQKKNEKGKFQLLGYMSALQRDGKNAIYGDSAVWNPNGSPYPHPTDPTKQIILRTFASDPGMIYYEIVDKPKAQEEPQTDPANVAVPIAVGVPLLLMGAEPAWDKGTGQVSEGGGAAGNYTVE